MIKDFLIAHKYKDNFSVHEKIKFAFLGKVIDDFVDEERIIKFAKRAAWLGNDETHYLRKWAGHDVDDLVALIKLTSNWIEIDHLSRSYVQEMPE